MGEKQQEETTQSVGDVRLLQDKRYAEASLKDYKLLVFYAQYANSTCPDLSLLDIEVHHRSSYRRVNESTSSGERQLDC